MSKRAFKFTLSATIFITCSIYFVNCAMRLVVDEEITNCGNKPWRFDLSKYEIVMINDTVMLDNGTVTITEEIKRPWKVHAYGEKYDRGHWHKMFERKFSDFCDFILRPGELWYSKTSFKLKGKHCPYPKGFEIKFNEEIIKYDLSWMPPNFEGRWKLNLVEDGRCTQFHYDLFDV